MIKLLAAVNVAVVDALNHQLGDDKFDIYSGGGRVQVHKSLLPKGRNLLLHKLDLSSRQREIVNVWLNRENLWDFDLNDMQGCAFQQGMMPR